MKNHVWSRFSLCFYIFNGYQKRCNSSCAHHFSLSTAYIFPNAWDTWDIYQTRNIYSPPRKKRKYVFQIKMIHMIWCWRNIFYFYLWYLFSLVTRFHWWLKKKTRLIFVFYSYVNNVNVNSWIMKDQGICYKAMV